LTADDEDGESIDSDGNADERELDAEAGDLGTEECDKLDEQMWASDDDEPITVRANALNECKISAVCVEVHSSVTRLTHVKSRKMHLTTSTSQKCYYATELYELFVIFFCFDASESH